MTHRSVALTTPNGESVDIDELLAPLITQVWQAGIATVSCCQDGGEDLADDAVLASLPHMQDYLRYQAGYAYVDFLYDIDAIEFLNAVANSGPRDAFYVRMVHWTAPGAWRKSVHIYDRAIDEAADIVAVPSRFALEMVKVEFPTTDIPEITRRLRRHNSGGLPILGQIDWRSVEFST